MCYSGRCMWEDHMGDCRFPRNKEVKEKYPLPVCEMNVQSEEEQEYVAEANADVKKILETIKENRNKSE